MIGIAELWLPILLSAAVVFVASSIVHMMTPWHKGEYPPVPNQDEVMKALRPFAIPPGDYAMPRANSMKEMQAPEFIEKQKAGPQMFITVLPNGPMSMGKALANWFIYSLVIAIFAAYVATRALVPGDSYLEVFRFVGVTAFCSYSLGLWQLRIWYHRALRTTLTATIDGLLYACLTGGVFGWLWPQ